MGGDMEEDVVRTVLVDNYDSYTYNLYHLLVDVNGGGVDSVVVVRNDAFTSYDEFLEVVGGRESFDNVVISPGPGRPENGEDFGGCAVLFSDHANRTEIPILGVCLGHQGLCHAQGAQIVHSPGGVAHGILSCIDHDGKGLFEGLPPTFDAVRYHSLAVDSKTLSSVLRVTAWCDNRVLDDGGGKTMSRVGSEEETARVVMGVQHVSLPHYGLQFHPESICTQFGRQILLNFRNLTRRSEVWRSCTSSRRRHVDSSPVSVSSFPLCEGVKGGGYRKRFFRVRWRKVAWSLIGGGKGIGWADTFTEEVFLGLYGHDEPAFWLDSPPHVSNARFSYMGDARGPYGEVITAERPGRTTVRRKRGLDDTSGLCRSVEDLVEEFDKPVLCHLNEQLKQRYCSDPASLSLPFKFNCGYVGYLGYELKAECGSGSGRHLSRLPDATMIFADRMIVFDGETNEVYLVCAGLEGDEEDKAAEGWFDETQARIAEVAEVERRRETKWSRERRKLQCASVPSPPPIFTMERTRSEYVEDVQRCLAEIHEGETYEVCLTNRIRTKSRVDALHLYQVLRERNRAPYSAFLRLGSDVAVCCSSPERFLRITDDGETESKPIKGTAKRGQTPEEDGMLMRGLEMSRKDRAENLMIVDLVRNDLSRSCQPGSVTVPKLMHVESFATVHQLVSTIRGKLRDDRTSLDCFCDSFPMGSMTGAPKLRTLQIIDQLEHSARGVYSGSIGFFALNGAIDTNVVIRTAVVEQNQVEIGVGGAIVSMSRPEEEFDEIILKGHAIMQAVALAATGSEAYELVN